MLARGRGGGGLLGKRGVMIVASFLGCKLKILVLVRASERKANIFSLNRCKLYITRRKWRDFAIAFWAVELFISFR